MDKSLDDIIRERKFSNPTNRFGRGRGAGGARGGSGGSGGRGGIAGNIRSRGRVGGGIARGRGHRPQPQQQQQQRQYQQNANITDARQKLIQKAHQGDARDRLARKARQTDARLKLSSRRRSGEGQTSQAPTGSGGERGVATAAAPLARTVPNLGSTFTVRNPARVQNKTQITIRNSEQAVSPQLSMGSSLRTSPRQSNPLLAGASTLRVTKAVPQPQKRPVVDYPHYGDDLLSSRQPNPPKVQRRMPESVMSQERSWGPGLAARIHAPAPPQGTRLIISNLQISVTEDDIKELFGAIGELSKARMVRPGWAEVVYVSRTDAIQAISTYHNRELDGKPMLCKLDTTTIPETSGNRTMPNTLSDRFKTMRPENNPKLPFEAMPKGGAPSGIDPGVVHKALFKKGSAATSQKPVVFTVKI